MLVFDLLYENSVDPDLPDGVRVRINGELGLLSINTIPGEKPYRVTEFDYDKDGDIDIVGHIDIDSSTARRIFGGESVEIKTVDRTYYVDPEPKRLLEDTLRWPTRSFALLYHVGTLDPNAKRQYSQEGRGLSVTTEPNAWRAIGRGAISGTTWVLTKSGNKFLDAHGLNKKRRLEIMRWAVEQRLVQPHTAYRASYYDDELGGIVHQDFSNMSELQQEYDDSSVRVNRVRTWMPTSELKRRVMHPHMSATAITDYVLPEWAAEHGYDGVWWQDRLNVFRMSAPRGVIVPERLRDWKTERIDDEYSQST